MAGFMSLPPLPYCLFTAPSIESLSIRLFDLGGAGFIRYDVMLRLLASFSLFAAGSIACLVSLFCTPFNAKLKQYGAHQFVYFDNC